MRVGLPYETLSGETTRLRPRLGVDRGSTFVDYPRLRPYRCSEVSAMVDYLDDEMVECATCGRAVPADELWEDGDLCEVCARRLKAFDDAARRHRHRERRGHRGGRDKGKRRQARHGRYADEFE